MSIRTCLHYWALVGALLAGLIASAGTSPAEESPQPTQMAEFAAVGPFDQASWFRRRWISDSDIARYCLRFEAPPPGVGTTRVVIAVHGFNSKPSSALHLIDGQVIDDLCVGTFGYPNDQSIDASARYLASQLRQAKLARPDIRFTLLTHSMGGIVARRVIEDPALDPGNVDRLVMVAPPNQGSELARIAVATDVWEHWLDREEGGTWQRVRDSAVDGFGEAASDLVPQSPFLRKLNARPRNTSVTYSVLLGSDASLTCDEMAWLRRSARLVADMPGTGKQAEKLCICIDDVDECIPGQGDGIVAVKRGRLAGVDDVVVLPFGHLSIIHQEADAATNKLRGEIVQRLR